MHQDFYMSQQQSQPQQPGHVISEYENTGKGKQAHAKGKGNGKGKNVHEVRYFWDFETQANIA